MSNSDTIYSSFSFKWQIKSTPYVISYKKAYDITEIDDIFCSLIQGCGSKINKLELGELLGFNIADDNDNGEFKDLAEESILEHYLKQVSEFDLIKVEKDWILLTDSGSDALKSRIKYSFHIAEVNLFENTTAKGEGQTFPFNRIFDIKSRIKLQKERNNGSANGDEIILAKLDNQLFEGNIYDGDVIEVYVSDKSIDYFEKEVNCKIHRVSDNLDISIYFNEILQPEITSLINKDQNTELREHLLRKGRYHHIIDNKIKINSDIISEYIDFWNWNELSQNKHVDWNDSKVFRIFKKYGSGSIWRNISELVPVTIIKQIIPEYHNYLDWNVLTQRIDAQYINEKINEYPWDFEELSHENSNLVIQLLSSGQFTNENWDWEFLSTNLSDEFLFENINSFPWNFHSITTLRFELFKKVFNSDVERQLQNPWDWEYISENIKVEYLFKHIVQFASKINWDTALDRFFNNQDVLSKCIISQTFKKVLTKSLPENFVIAHQNYSWSFELISFLDDLGLINWISKSYSKGFDTNQHVLWDNRIFKKFSTKIITEEGYTNISSLVTEKKTILDNPNFKWDWEAISTNKYIIEDPGFISEVLGDNRNIWRNLNWGKIYPTKDIPFWNRFLQTIYKTIDSEKSSSFWQQITKDESIEFILENISLPWDWNTISSSCAEYILYESFDNEDLLPKWNWEITTKRLDKQFILDNLELGTPFWDWNYLLKDLFGVNEELDFENGELIRIATCISVLETEKRNEIWKTLTSLFPIEVLFDLIEITSNITVFEWDWDIISGLKHLPTDLISLDEYKNELNWTLFSENPAIQDLFSYKNWGDDRKGCYKNITKYLTSFRNRWDWKILSHNEDINWDRQLIKEFSKEGWDWEYLSEHGKFLDKRKNDNNDYLIQLVQQFPVDFDLLSGRTDIVISSKLLLSKRNEDWDWEILSTNKKAILSSELLFELKNKEWNWKSLASRKDVKLNNELLLALRDKDWDWGIISNHSDVVYSCDFIKKIIHKPLDWTLVSHHQSFTPSIEVLTLTKEFNLDWNYLSDRSDFTPKRDILSKFEDFWNWNIISKRKDIDLSDVELISRFKNRWDWSYLCEAGKISLNKEFLTDFKDFLDWDLLSSNSRIEFSKNLIDEYFEYWNWHILNQNSRAKELLGNYIEEKIKGSPKLTFLVRIENQDSNWKSSIYHFSHIDNAAEIIKNRTIQSRNRANILSDAAGNVIQLRDDAHSYARFYFRPLTPTQFYNEFLGKNVTDGYRNNKTNQWVSWYERARGLGFPKCPVPIFFRFSLKEILSRIENSCCISNGNMQTKSTTFGSIESMIDRFGFEDLYFTPEQYATKDDYNRYKNYAQQEFLIKDELRFNELSDFNIICPSESDKVLLINMIGHECADVYDKIIVDSSYYNNENPRVKIIDSESDVEIYSEYKGKGYFNLHYSKIFETSMIKGGDVEKQTNSKLIFKSHLTLDKSVRNIRITFTDESNREWFIYSK